MAKAKAKTTKLGSVPAPKQGKLSRDKTAMFNHLFDAKMGITAKKATNGEITKLRKDCTTKTSAHFDLVSTFGYKPPNATGRAKLAVTDKAMEAAGRALDKAIRQK